MTRLYVPATLGLLAHWVETGAIPGSAVLDAVVADSDSEEAEYAALVTAADASAGLLVEVCRPDRSAAATLRTERRRVVLVVETSEVTGGANRHPDAPGPRPGPGSVRMSDVVSCHVDTQDDADPDDDLAWYAPQEIPTLLP